MPKLSSKNQVTIPVDVLREAGIEPGEDIRVRAIGKGKVEIARQEHWIDEFKGSVPGLGPSDEIKRLRREWDPR